jgi:FMN phosphatase YigB (HAD superfamily)
MKHKEMRVVVFDLDETLGYFQQFAQFCQALEFMKKKKLNPDEVMFLLNLYPEYFRPNIFEIMQFLKQKKINKEVYKVCIYTNNNGPKQWAKQIYKFIEQKINYKLFDTHIGAYKVDGVQIEKTRTTYNKTLRDFVTTVKIPSNAKICFIDDLYHPQMTSNNVTYIKVQPYTIELPINVITSRFCQNTRCNIPYNEFNKAISGFLNAPSIPHNIKTNHIANGEKILKDIQSFFIDYY